MQFVFCNISCKYSSSQDIGEIDKILNQIDYSSKAKFFADFDEYKMKGLEELVKTELQVPFIVIDSINNSKILYLVSSIDHVCRIEYEYREDYLVKHKIEKDLDTFIHEYTLHDYEKKYTFIYVSDSKKSLNNAYLLELEINSKESGYGYIFNNKAFFLPPQILSKDFSPDKEYIFSYIDIVKKKSNESIISEEKLVEGYDKETKFHSSKTIVSWDVNYYPYIFRNCNYSAYKMLLK